jgi:transposase
VEGKVRSQFLGRYEGILQTDGYAGYDRVGGPEMIHAASWARMRNETFRRLPSPSLRSRGHWPSWQGIDELFAIEARAGAEARSRSPSSTAATASTPLLEKLRSEIKAALHGALPASALAKACNNTLALWPKLTRFLEHPQLELSNNLVENSMRTIALGRKTGSISATGNPASRSPQSSPPSKTCKRLDIPIRDYLAQVLPRLAPCGLLNSTNLHPPHGTQRSSFSPYLGCSDAYKGLPIITVGLHSV